MDNKLNWLITGVSSGFGRTLAEVALAAGHRVAGTVRRPEQLAEFEAIAPGRALAFLMDVTQSEQVDSAVQAAARALGSLDVLVNNVGYGLFGALEEVTDAQIERNLQTNLVGPLRVMRAALPILRAQGRGHIINMSAIAAFSNEMGFSVYGGAKAALEAASEALAAEVAPLGLRVSVVEPGPFRTDFIGRSLDRAPVSLEAYQGTSGRFGAFLESINGQQPGDPVRAAEAIVRIAGVPDAPFRLVLGGYAYTKFRKQLERLSEELNAWESVGLPTDFAS